MEREVEIRPGRRARALVLALPSAALALLVLDLVFLGVVAKSFFDEAFGPLRRASVLWPAALLFYAMYVSVLGAHAVLPAGSTRDAFRRGAGLGFAAYGTYELTNWAVLEGWPAVLVPVDILWGVVLTALVAAFSRAVVERWGR